MRGRHFYVAGFAITLGIIAYGDISQCKAMPWPPKIVATAIVFGILDLFSGISEDLSGIIAIGIVLAAVVNKGFTSNCNHAEATAQPASYQSLNGTQNQGTIIA